MTSLASLISLQGRRALITGGAGNIARAMADTLAEMGAELVLVDRDATALAAVAGELKERWDLGVDTQVCDLEDEPARNALIADVGAPRGGIDILINNAAFVGTSDMPGWGVPFPDQTLDAWRRAVEVNLTAAFHLTQGLMPSLRARGRGSVINIGSIYGQWGPDWNLYAGTDMANPAAYAASKGGLIQLTRWLATTVAPEVRVNAISPGGVERGQPATFVDRYNARTPLGRMATEDDFRGAVAYLASDLSAYVTGQVLAVDGGWSAW